jgi:hypothetical protein
VNCENCKHWFVAKYDAIGMGYCDVPVSLRETAASLTAWDWHCSNFSERPNTGMKADAAGVPAGDGESSTRGAAYAWPLGRLEASMHQVIVNSARRLELTGPVAVGDEVDFRGIIWVVSAVMPGGGAYVKPLPGDPEPEPERDAFTEMRAKTRVDRDIKRAMGRKAQPPRAIPAWVAELKQERFPITRED